MIQFQQAQIINKNMTDKKTEDLGAIIGIILVVIVLLVGAFYFINQRIEKSREFKAAMEQSSSTLSDEIVDIENTATSMNFDNLGNGIDNL